MEGRGRETLPLFYHMERKNATELTSKALLGLDGENILVGGNVYYIQPPTIKKIVGAGLYLADFGKEKTIGEYFANLGNMGNACKALSWLIQGDESLTENLSLGTFEEVVSGIEKGIGLMGVENFYKLSLLGKSVQMTIAKQR